MIPVWLEIPHLHQRPARKTPVHSVPASLHETGWSVYQTENCLVLFVYIQELSIKLYIQSVTDECTPVNLSFLGLINNHFWKINLILIYYYNSYFIQRVICRLVSLPGTDYQIKQDVFCLSFDLLINTKQLDIIWLFGLSYYYYNKLIIYMYPCPFKSFK